MAPETDIYTLIQGILVSDPRVDHVEQIEELGDAKEFSVTLADGREISVQVSPL